MKLRYLGMLAILAAVIGGITFALSAESAEAGGHMAMYRVTIENRTGGQPFSPPVLATHNKSISMFDVGGMASAELEAIAENGDNSAMFALFGASADVMDVVDVGAPILAGSATTVDIMGVPGSKLSIATMLICTNDGITGLHGAKLPKKGTTIFLTNGYDAGTEDDTEDSMDIVDPCSAAGPIVLPGDPNGNDNDLVDATPHLPIALHAGIAGA